MGANTYANRPLADRLATILELHPDVDHTSIREAIAVLGRGGALGALRAARDLTRTRGPMHPVDADLDREAGMDGNMGHLLQAARDLDAGDRS